MISQDTDGRKILENVWMNIKKLLKKQNGNSKIKILRKNTLNIKIRLYLSKILSEIDSNLSFKDNKNYLNYLNNIKIFL